MNKKKIKRLIYPAICTGVGMIASLICLILFSVNETGSRSKENEKEIVGDKELAEVVGGVVNPEVDQILSQVDRLISGYYYDEAVELLNQSSDQYRGDIALETKLQAVTNAKDNLVAYRGVVDHVFFHSLIVDTNRAFDGDYRARGYNLWMTTVSEFNAILESMYEKGFVLVSIHDVNEVTKDEQGNRMYKAKDILLPEGKKPFILSIDDVNYYTYMQNDGFADRLVVTENGEVKNRYYDAEGNVLIGDYDVVPLLDRFIKKHPDFSYQGARGLIAETGYNGALGYRYREKNPETNKYELVENYEQLMEEAKVVANRLKETGWEFAVHGWGHKHSAQITYDQFKEDTDLWLAEVGSIVGATDVYIYPYGEEVQYPSDKYNYLKLLGFTYYCGVDSSPFLSIRPYFIRSARRNLDGYSMHFRPEKLADLFDASQVWDKSRPEITDADKNG